MVVQEQQQTTEINPLDHIPLIKSIIKRIGHNNEEEFEDMLQWGMVGLLKAIKVYDPTKGAFSTIAFQRIFSSIMNHHILNRFIIKIPPKINTKRHESATSKKLKRISYTKPYSDTTLETKGNDTFVNEVLGKLSVEETMTGLSKQSQFIVKMRLEGQSEKYIGQQLGYTNGWVSWRIVNHIRPQIKALMSL